MRKINSIYVKLYAVSAYDNSSGYVV